MLSRPMHSDYIARETAISAVINAGFSLAFFLLVFGTGGAVVGLGTYAYDFLPQSCAIAVMSTLVPGAIAGGRLRKGALVRSGRTGALPGGLLLRTVVMAVIGTLIGGLVCAFLLLGGPSTFGWWSALAGKLAHGAALAVLVTPAGLRAALR